MLVVSRGDGTAIDIRVAAHAGCSSFFFFQAEDGIRDLTVTGVQTCALPIYQRQCQPPRRGGARARRCAQTYAPNGWRSMMVCSRSGPVEIMSMGTPTRL